VQLDRPTPQELAEAVREFLQEEILPTLDDHRLKFRTLVAINGLGIAERELWATARPRGRAPEGAGRAEAPNLEPPRPREVRRVRRRLYLMRHAEVAYFENGRPVDPHDVRLTAEGREQARATGEALAGIRFDRVITSGAPRTLETAALVAPEHEPERWPELYELTGGRLSDIPEERLEEEFVHAFRGVVPNDARFLRGESIGELFDRVLPALERLLAEEWDTLLAVLHGGVNRAILSYALTAERMYLGPIEQSPACVNVLDVGDDWIVRAVNLTPYDLAHLAHRQTTMERYWADFRG
jgi:broad specificity phosphatase PhoE